ncbi:DNA polymerase III subunit delta' [Oscillibacter valericigenes]|uniref:DNA polymerase III subunit delta' n=1 Tax=Oscillibacter valericigenes TaxID=351091 RepID=UPI001F2D45EE|nr:DNA polymerase III subunit delta' [Oscillibacter valericigenes]MCF2616298.1 DNA polymerase III subunit delta' [Oscillibacter valericigenes]
MAVLEELKKDPAAARIREAAGRGTLSHALLFTGGGDKTGLARYAAAAMECMAAQGQPCGVCPACRKVLEDIHPDVITVRDPEHKNIAVDVVRAIRSDAYIRPNEGQRKVYIFPDCALLTEQDQNVLLKIVEEGPPYAAFLFCAENPSQVLRTLRSRCVEIKLRPGSEEDGEPSEAAEALCRAIGSRRRGAVAELAVRLEKKKLDREALSAMLERSRAAFAAALLLLYGQEPGEMEIAPFLAKNLTKSQIMSTIELLQKYHGECAYNVGPGHVLGALAAELEGIL